MEDLQFVDCALMPCPGRRRPDDVSKINVTIPLRTSHPASGFLAVFRNTSAKQETSTFSFQHFCFRNRRSPAAVKPWPNGIASRRNLKTWVYLRLRLARPCVHLR